MKDHGSLRVLLGPRTRLGHALRDLDAVDAPWAVVARSQKDEDELQSEWPGATVIKATGIPQELPSGLGRLVVCCCAAGAIHPSDSGWQDDLRAAERDLTLVNSLLLANPEAEVSIIFVSSVLALAAASNSRRSYSGWKNIMESALRHLSRQRTNSSFSVFYPGRLVERRSIGQPASVLSTSYRALARRVADACSRMEDHAVVVGWDARLWLLGKAIRTGASAFLHH